MPEDDEGVGYGKPPRHSRFQKGKSGNPFGRRGQTPKPETRPEVVRRVRDEKVIIKLNGKEVHVTAFEAAIRSVFNRTMHRGNAHDLKLLFDLLDQHGGLSAIDEAQRAKEGADAVMDKIMTIFCRTNDIDEKHVTAARQRQEQEIVILFTFPQAIAALRKFWKGEDAKERHDKIHWSHLRSLTERHWDSL